MKIEEQGIVLYAPEIKALLKFAATDPTNPHAVVHFRTEGDRLYAYATNGHRALQARGVAENESSVGEWTVFRDFLKAGLKLIGANEYLVLEVSGASLNRAVVRNAETLEELSSVHWPKDAATFQTTFPHEYLRNYIQIPTTERPLRCVTVNAEYLADLAVVSKGAGTEHLDLYPGKTREDPLTFQLDGDGTTWTGVILPIRKGESETDDVGHEEPTVAPTNPKQPGLAFADAVLALGDEAPEGAR